MNTSSIEFRPLNEMELKTILAASTPKKGINRETGLPHQPRIPADDLRDVQPQFLQVSYERMQGGFTVCILIWQGYGEDGEPKIVIWRGASRRSYKDARKPIRGEMLAFHRAIYYSRPVTIIC